MEGQERMAKETPKFNRTLAQYFTNLRLEKQDGVWRECRFSGEKFYIRPEDIAFYKRIGVPLPTLHPNERWRRLSAYENSYNIFRITSAWSKKPIIAAYPPETPYKIYEHQVWRSDKWDPISFGHQWIASKGFFNQFSELQKLVPRPNLITYPTNIGSDYTNTSSNLKNCYLVFNTLSGENLYYVDGHDRSMDCVDGNSFTNSTNCYSCRDITNSYHCFFCEECSNCLESAFLFDCRNCDRCFMSTNLRNKKYCFRNKQLSKEEYEQHMRGVYLGNYNEVQKYVAEFAKIKRGALYKVDNNIRTVNCLGDYNRDSKNCYFSLYVMKSVGVNYSLGLTDYRDSCDIVGGGGGELCYELMTVSTSGNYGVKLSSQIDNCREVEYCDLCRNCSYCFGCIGLENKSFCILNRQYTEEEYWKLVDHIKTSMLTTGEYGEFFPPALMPIPYKISFATSYTGFDDYARAVKFGYDVSDVKNSAERPSDNGAAVIHGDDLPLDIRAVDDDILTRVVHDTANNRYFRIMPYELDFYRRNGLALPREHPIVRIFRFRKPYAVRLKFYDRRCGKCGATLLSPREVEKYPKLLCEDCYNTEVS
ncbi:MAG: hypothetical protein A2939_03135 [Parcubacteria group bacterium RIFCSPLOWO2_01_FULL_48_18]|nr:MAG: hypothetical protein A2939_03135 [Parcubacteria group bacterium RIFCSPLOWO2_01_FULL_48_18]